VGFGWFIFWSVAIFFVQQYTPVLAYVLSIYLIFSFYWVAQGTPNSIPRPFIYLRIYVFIYCSD
jgi:hypothetical protein